MKTSSLLFGAASGALLLAAAAGANAQSWTDSTTIGGRTYMDVSSNELTINGVKSGNKNGIGFDVKRVYFQVDKKFNDLFSAQLQTDVSSIAGVGQSLYIKKAFIKASFSPAFEVSLGANEMPWIPYAESIYGQRFLENTVLEQNNDGGRGTFGTSADWGVHVGGKLNDVLSYQVSVVNGNGYRDTTRSKTMDVEGRLSAKIDQWNFAIGGYTGKRGQSVYGSPTILTPAVGSTPAVYQQNLVATPHTAQRLNLLAAFVGDRLKVGVEGFTATDWAPAAIKDTAAGHPAGDKADGASAFASYRVTPEYMVFARLDSVKPSKTLAPRNKDDYYNFGIQTSPLKGITLVGVVKHDRLNAYSSAGALTRTEFTEVGVFTEVRF